MIAMDGVLIIDKPAGLTSHDVVARVRRIIGERRVGHTGTLDPFATGVLVILVGRATRLAQFLSGAEKEYEATIRFGYATDTGDVTGTLIQNETNFHVPEFTSHEIESALSKFRGEIDQVPPMYSAKKHKGRKLYELARSGEEIERKPVRVTINEFFVPTNLDQPEERNEDGTVDLAVRVVCSAGTYVRTLAEDLGRELGVGAHLISLRRTRAGDFQLTSALTLEELQSRVDGNILEPFLVSLDTALSRLPFLHLSAAEAERVRHGMRVQADGKTSADWAEGQQVRVRAEDASLIAIGIFELASRTLHPKVVFAS